MLPKLDHPGSANTFTVAGVPAKLSRTPGSVRCRAPLLGEHTAEVLREAGLTSDEIDALKRERAVV
jgi:crotonobetainyl-CoA:carnitine CoA-transferase CaiB-like acyl-CoA transferase